MSHDGLVPPDSVAWRVHGDASALVGGIRSLMVQSLHPRAMAGVAQHSDLMVDFWGRVRRTSEWLLTVVYGSTADAERYSGAVRAVHARVRGIDSFTGKPYAADDPDLLIWVANATVESHLVGYQRFGAGMTAAEADQYVREMRVIAVLMGLDEMDVAQDVADLRRYFCDVKPQLAGSPDARRAVRGLLNPDLPFAVRPLWTVPAGAALGSMPIEYQRMLGLSWLAPLRLGARISGDALVKGLRLVIPVSPAVEAARARH